MAQQICNPLPILPSIFALWLNGFGPHCWPQNTKGKANGWAFGWSQLLYILLQFICGIYIKYLKWIFSCAYLAFILIAAFSVPEMALQTMPYLTSAYSSTTSLIANIVALLVVIFTALCDWRITILNKRIRAQR